MLKALADRQTAIETALIHVAKGEPLPAGLAERLNEGSHCWRCCAMSSGRSAISTGIEPCKLTERESP
jgi:hypothetical protein